MTDNAEIIQLQNIKKNFGDKKVIRDVSFSVKQGEIFGMLGPSGAGKTTLIRIITGQLKADEGKCMVHGIPSDKLNGRDHRTFGIMMDQFGLYERFSCRENLKLFARIYGVPDAKISEVLEKVGLKGAEKTPAGRLSKGMMSRLRLARAFMTDPEILFLDEPTSGLDPATAKEIHQMILAEKERGKTIFLTTHTMSEAEKLCDKIVLLHEGTIWEEGSPAEICRRHDHQKKLLVHLTNGRDLCLSHDGDSAQTLFSLMQGGQAQTIHTTEPNLETVFLELTGKELEA